MPKTNETWYAIVNPDAGSGKTLAQWRTTETMLYNKGISYKFVTPETPSDAVKRVKAACRAGFRKFIAVGGDGTVHKTLNSIVEYVTEDSDGVLEEYTLAVLPIGSGNDWIKSHNVPHDHRKIVDLIAAGSFSKQDVVKVQTFNPENGKVLSTSYMANIGGYNFDANVCDVVNFQKANGATGKLMYVNALRRLSFIQKVARTKVVCDGRTIFEDNLYTISIGNGKFSGGGLCQTPSAIMDDGFINIMIAPKVSILKVLFNVKKLLEQRTESIKELVFDKARKIEVIPQGQGQLVEVDGDIVGRGPAIFEVMDEKINVLHVDKK